VKENVGDTDQRVRAVVGTALVGAAIGPLGARSGRLPGLAALVGGALVLESAITRTCPINEWLGIDTREDVGRP
jgi:hypothetical protein